MKILDSRRYCLGIPRNVYRHGKWDISAGFVKLQIGFIRHGLGEEIATNHAFHSGVNKCRPGKRRLLFGFVRSRMIASFFKDVASARVPDTDAQLHEFADNMSKPEATG